jgi:4-hydroxy-tetrahydrodipicolinate reductase
MLKYGIFGFKGKMGVALQNVAKEFKDAKLEVLLERDFAQDDVKKLDFIIDFSSPAGSLNLLKKLQGQNLLIVCGTTGFTEAEFNEYKNLARVVKVLYSANFSFGIMEIKKVLSSLAKSFSSYDVEIFEKHHRLKKDAPSGTALMLGAEVAKVKGQNFQEVKSVERNKLRKEGEIGFACLRQGSVFGFHEVSFANEDERIWLGHEAFNKNIFAKGAIFYGTKGCVQIKENGFFTLEDLV